MIRCANIRNFGKKFILICSRQIVRRQYSQKDTNFDIALVKTKIDRSNNYLMHYGLLSTKQVCYSFVNIPIKSAYYHKQLPIKIQPALLMAQRQQKLNQKCYLLENAADIVLRDPKVFTNSVKNKFVTELKKWEGTSGRFVRIVTVGWIIRKLQLRDRLKDLYEDIVRRVDEDEWYVNFDQSVKAIEVFSDYPNDQIRNRIYQKIQRNLGITLNDVNMVYYQRITQGLLQAGRYQSQLWNKIQQFVLRNLGMEYTPKVFFDIFKAFAISRNGTDNFYEISQQIIFKGHLYNKTHYFRSNLGDYNSSGQFFALLAETYAIVNRYTPFPLDPDFLDYMYKSMRSSRLQYKQISSLTKILKYLPQMDFHSEQIDDICTDIIQNKNFENYASLQEISQLFEELQYKYGKIPEKLMQKVELLVDNDIKRKVLPLPMAIETINYFCDKFEKQGKSINFKTNILHNLDEYLNKRYKYLRVEEAEEVRNAIQMFKEKNQQRKLKITQKILMIPQK